MYISKKIYTNAKDIKERTKLLIFVIGTCGMWNQLTTKLPMGPLEDTGTFFFTHLQITIDCLMEEIQENSRIIWAVSITAYIQTGIYHLRLVSIQKLPASLCGFTTKKINRFSEGNPRLDQPYTAIET